MHGQDGGYSQGVARDANHGEDNEVVFLETGGHPVQLIKLWAWSRNSVDAWSRKYKKKIMEIKRELERNVIVK